MGYYKDINRGGSYHSRNYVGLMSNERAFGREAASPIYLFYELEPAQVISVNTTDKDSRELGKAVVRPLYSYATVPETNLPTATPLDSNIKSYPLKNEVVIVVEYNGFLYYTQRMNYFNLTNNNVTKDPFSYLEKDKDDKRNFAATSAGNPNATNEDSNKPKPGVYFEIDNTVRSLLPMEGDIIYEGRFGQSIRFGGSVERNTSGVDSRFKGTWAIGEKVGSPIIILRSGQSSGGSSTAPYVEDINKDPSSIYITNGQIIPLKIASLNQKSWHSSAPSLYDGNQVVISSDRIILNARRGEVMVFSTAPIGFSTQKSFLVDTGVDVVINSPKIYLGLDATERVVLGDKTAEWLKSLIGELKNLIGAIGQIVVRTGTGPSDPVNGWTANVSNFNQINSSLTRLESKIDTLLSKQNYTL